MALFPGKSDREDKACDLESEEELRFLLKLSLSQEAHAKYEELKSLLSSKYPKGASMEQILEVAMDYALDALSPERREQRRAKRCAAKNRNLPKTRKSPNKVDSKRTRYMSRALKDKVFVRDQGCCAFVSKDGMRCRSKHDLEVHHKTAFARRGAHTLENLTLYCRAHNQYAAEQDFGSEFMRKARTRMPSI